MKIYNNILYISIVFLILFSCSKQEDKTYKVQTINGIRITENSSTPADTSFQVKFNEILSIKLNETENPEQCFRDAHSLDFDDKGNLFVLDRNLFKIFKYNSSGKFERSFGGQGQGPGEFVQPGSLIIRKDTLIVTDLQSYRINKFDLDGEFLYFKKFENAVKFPGYINKFGENYVKCASYSSTVYSDGRDTSRVVTALYDSDFNFVKYLHKLEYETITNPKAAYDPSKVGVEATCSDKDVYIYEHSKTKYEIDVYDKNGDLKRIIRKKYIRLKTPEYIKKILDNVNKTNGTKNIQKFVNSLYKLQTDKYGRLWVRIPGKSLHDNKVYEIFEDDIFINRISHDIEQIYEPYFVKDKVVGVSRYYMDDVFTLEIKIYDY